MSCEWCECAKVNCRLKRREEKQKIIHKYDVTFPITSERTSVCSELLASVLIPYQMSIKLIVRNSQLHKDQKQQKLNDDKCAIGVNLNQPTSDIELNWTIHAYALCANPMGIYSFSAWSMAGVDVLCVFPIPRWWIRCNIFIFSVHTDWPLTKTEIRFSSHRLSHDRRVQVPVNITLLAAILEQI